MKVEIFGKENCAACTSSKIVAFSQDNMDVEYKLLDVDYTLDELLEKLSSSSKLYSSKKLRA